MTNNQTYYERNREKVLAYQKQYYLRNRDKIKQYNADYWMEKTKPKKLKIVHAVSKPPSTLVTFTF